MVGPLLLPPAPVDDSGVFGRLSALGCVTVEPVGRWFESVYCNPRARHASSAASVGSQSSDEDEQDGGAPESPADTRYLLSLDPKEWRQQDHYRVLGLQAKRHRATEHDLKKACECVWPVGPVRAYVGRVYHCALRIPQKL
ncbi:dnaJ homolog subfamily C member 2 [Ixodes scapularis]